jgi:hypothetical protein
MGYGMRIAMSAFRGLWKCLPGRVSVSPTNMKRHTTMDDAKLRTTHAPRVDPEPSQELDPEFYREALLHIARLTTERLLRERSALADIERRAKIPLMASKSPDAITIESVHRSRVEA